LGADAIGAGAAPDRRAAVQLLRAEVSLKRGDRPGALVLARRARERVADLHYGSDVIAQIDRWLARGGATVRPGTGGKR